MAIIKLNNNALTSVTELPSGVGQDPDVKIDLARIGLRTFANGNLAAQNSNSASFDVFQDSTGIENLTNSARDTTNEFMASQVIAYTGDTDTLLFDANTKTAAQVHANEFDTNNIQAENWIIHTASSENDLRGSYNTNGSTNIDGNGKSQVVSGMLAGSGQTSNDGTYEYFGSHTSSYQHGQTIVIDTKAGVNGNDYFLRKYYFHTIWNPASVAMILYGNNDGGTSWTTLSDQNPSSTGGYTYTFSPENTSNTIYRYLKFRIGYATNRDCAFTKLKFYGDYKATTTNATGSFEGTSITAPSSTDKLGAVITYEDSVGTNALNTDLVLQLSADNGSNFSTATLTALPDFATGVKCCKVTDLSVTAGTQLKYKISFANQNGASKVCKVKGVSLQY